MKNRHDAETGVHCKHFSQYWTHDEIPNHYDGELEAIKAALQSILYRPHVIQKIVILIDSKSAIKGIVISKKNILFQKYEMLSKQQT